MKNVGYWIALLGMAGLGYMLLSGDDRKKYILENTAQADRGRMSVILKAMSEQELSDTVLLIRSTRENRPITEPTLRRRLEAISQKYSIFT